MLKALLIPLQAVALLGFLLSAYVHIESIFGIVAFEQAMYLHGGIFLVFIPAIVIVNSGSQSFFAGSFGGRSARKRLWKLLLRGCPSWMVKFTYGLFVYAILNFVLLFFTAAGHKLPASKELSPEMLHGFSGHWMIFYWVSFALMYSRSHTNGPVFPVCGGCKNQVSPFEKFCGNCGKPIPASEFNLN